MELHKIIIIDLGSQTTNLIARRIRGFSVCAEVVESNISAEQIIKQNPIGIILSGSPMSVTDQNYPDIDRKIFDLNLPILGICFGMYLIADHLGGSVGEMLAKEYGSIEVSISKSKLFSNIPNKVISWMNHGSEIKTLNDKYTKVIASTKLCSYAAIENQKKNIYGVQFHPEVEHSEYGQEILSNFVFDICNANKNWNLDNWLSQKILHVKQVIGDKKAICAVSGGVDSTTAAVLCAKAIGSNLHCIFVDTGLMRLNEVDEVKKNLLPYNLSLHIIEAKERFFAKLKNVVDPEIKRKIIGLEYINIFEEEAQKIQNVDYLIQGTIYSDKIESSKTSKHSSNIKSHHNVGGLPDKMAFKIYEPLDELFKDEVRKISKTLGLNEDIYSRHPFPGPGLAIQIIGEITEENVEITRHADAIVIDEVKKAGLYDKIGEIFTNFTGVRTTGIKGDARAYEWLLAIRSVDPSDLMTSSWSQLPYELLAKMSNRITSEVKGVNRVVYDITTKPPATIRWE